MGYRDEVYRKLIHIGSAVIPVAYLFFLDRQAILWILGPATGAILVGEILRMKYPFFTRLYKVIFGKFVREEEDRMPTAATFSLLGALSTVYVFEKNVAVFALLVVSLGDATAALVGRKWGKTPLLGKSVEGTGTFLFVALMLAIFLPGLPRTPALAGAIFATVVELLPSPVNDNLMVPLATATSLSLIHLIS
ncbi:MAG: diacylglycerol/polyprenol kinase family protein [Fidelibacterota bacterium]